MKAKSRREKRGAKIRVRTGAMFSMTLCFASTSQVATTAAPATPQGRIQASTCGSTSLPFAWKRPKVCAMSTPPPRAIRT